MNGLFAIIGGSGLYHLDDSFKIESAEKLNTPYGPISAELEIGKWHGHRVAFLPRHGRSHVIPPHRINYRANLWALQSIGVKHIIAANAVGGISVEYAPEVLGVPDQIVDYTASREHSFCDDRESGMALRHVDFTWPYSRDLRSTILAAAEKNSIDLVDKGTYGCTNGPRLETAAEIRKLRADGCDIVGMTGMPEAALARELDLDYASIVLVVNWCAGIDDTEISMNKIQQVLEQGVDRIRHLILSTLAQAKS